MGDAMLLGFQQMIDAERAGQTWLNSVPVVDGLLGELQQVAWKARVQEAMGEISAATRAYKIGAKVGELVQIFDGRHPGYAVIPWNTDPGQMKGHLINTYWCDSEPEDAPTIADVLERTLDDCAAASVFGVESLLRGCHPALRRTTDQVADDLQDTRHRTGACLMGLPPAIYEGMAWKAVH